MPQRPLPACVDPSSLRSTAPLSTPLLSSEATPGGDMGHSESQWDLT